MAKNAHEASSPSVRLLFLLPLLLAFAAPLLVRQKTLPCPWSLPVLPVHPQHIPNPQPAPEHSKRSLIGTKLFEGEARGVETTIVGPHGELFMPNEKGQVLMAPSGSAPLQEWAFTGGRGLGGKIDADGNLILCHVPMGLIKVDTGTRQTSILAARVTPGTGAGEGSEILFADDLDIASDGTIYFTDMAAVQPVRDEEGHYDLLAAHKANLLQGEPSGRLLAYDPPTGTTRVLLDKIWAANGVAMAQDGASVVVSSTNTACLLRYWLAGDKAGTSEVLVRDLPGMIDSISTASDGGFWLAMPAPFTVPLVAAMKSPVMRWLVSWLPHRLQPIPPPHSAIIKVSSAGHVELFTHDDTKKIHSITAVNEYQGKLYLGHLGTDYVAEVHLKDLQ